MVEIKPKGNSFSLLFTEQEVTRLGLEAGREYELTKVREGIWVLAEGATIAKKAETKKEMPKQMQPFDGMEEKIAQILRKTPTRDRMEGWFEKKLTDGEREKFAQMLSEGKVIKYKSSEVFRKSLYALPKKPEKNEIAARKFENREKPIEEFTIENDGFVVVKNELRAKAISAQYYERIKSGEIRGMKSFSGEFYIILSGLLMQAQEKLLTELRAVKSAELKSISEKSAMTPTLIKIAATFLSEEGQIIEKKKGLYQYIK